jgi:hypothetical protein
MGGLFITTSGTGVMPPDRELIVPKDSERRG